MTLLCIDTPKTFEQGIDTVPIVKVGHKYHVNDNSDIGYELIEHLGYIYAFRLFIPLSEIDERELLHNRQTELA